MEFVRSSSLSKSSKKRRGNFVRKLNEQVENIDQQVKVFNEKQLQHRPLVKGNRRMLRTLTQPKIQKKFQKQLDDPEKDPLELNTKINKLFNNCSTLTQFDFGVDDKFLKSQSLATESNIKISRSIYLQLFERKNKIESEWKKIDRFRNTKGIRNQEYTMGVNAETGLGKRVNSILRKVQKNRPATSIIYSNQ